MSEKDKKYNIVIVLCPSEARIIKNKFFYHELVEDKQEKGQMIYLGGRVRMQAAVDIAPCTNTIIVVGGSQKKVNDMKGYLLQEFKKEKLINPPEIIRIESEPDTNGNLWAIKNCFQSAGKINLLEKNVGILTNAYHLLRAMRFASDIFNNINFIPVAAESVLRKNYPEYQLHPKSFLLRTFKEIGGLKDWEEERYRDQKKTIWNYKCHDELILNGLQ